ncbi:MAG: DUF3179 domain-containing protein, partial [Salinirussus sp.]
MSERLIFAAVLAVLLAGTVIGVPALPGDPPTRAPDGEIRRTVDGVKYTVHPSELVQGCLTGQDCIQAIDDPTFVSPSDVSIAGDARVIGLEVDGEARAYPLARLAGHEIVNDRIDGRPVAVTYCPLCRSGIVFSRRVDGRTLTFGVSGKLLDANLIMYDRQTETYWSQLMAKAIVGDLVPAKLELIPSSITTWAEWRRGHPDTVVLGGRGSVGGRDPYAGYRESDSVGFGVDVSDDRLEPKEVVYGLSVNGSAVAYPESELSGEGIIQDTIGGEPVLLVRNPADGTVAAFSRRVNGESLTFRRENGHLVDGAGHAWTVTGEAQEGPRAGATLNRL